MSKTSTATGAVLTGYTPAVVTGTLKTAASIVSAVEYAIQQAQLCAWLSGAVKAKMVDAANKVIPTAVKDYIYQSDAEDPDELRYKLYPFVDVSTPLPAKILDIV